MAPGKVAGRSSSGFRSSTLGVLATIAEATIFGLADIEVIGQPTEVEGARAMLDGSLDSQYQFQWWALDLVGAQPQGGEKKGADKGVDGIIKFSGPGRTMESAIVSVKSGGVGAAMIQQLKGAMDTHGAAMGLFITLTSRLRR